MTSVTSVDGLVSGLNTTQIISQLMAVEAQPQNALKTHLQSQQSVLTAYQSVNGKLAALQSAAEALTGFGSWNAVTATSSSDAVKVAATSGAATGSLTFDVTSLAKAHVVTAILPADGPGTTGGGLQISLNGADPLPIDVFDDSPQGVADAINGADLGLRASVLTTDQGSVLQVAATSTGAASRFTIDGLAGDAKVLTDGSDATITVGDPTDPAKASYTVSSPTNTITGVMPGVTLTALKQATGVTVAVASDAGGMADKVQAMVTAANAALAEIRTDTAYDTTKKTGAALTGNLMVQQIQQKLLSAVSTGRDGYGSFKQLGIQLDSSGNLTFDRTAFLSAYAADPAGTQTALAANPAGTEDGGPQGLASALAAVAKAAASPAGGTITSAIQSGNDRIRGLNDEIADWDTRLSLRQAALQRQFTTLETTLGKLKDQSNWLAGQLASLPTTSG